MHRIPMLVIPHGRDQADNAVRVTERGAGLAVSRTAPTADIRAALDRLVSEPEFRTAARTLGDKVVAELQASSLVADLESLAGGDGKLASTRLMAGIGAAHSRGLSKI